MQKVSAAIRKGYRAVEDLNLLKILQSEIQLELSSNPFQRSSLECSLGDFVVEWDSPLTQDVFLKRKLDSGEEVGVSAMLGAFTDSGEEVDISEREEHLYPRDLLMKVCVKKPGLNSMLQFDCDVLVDSRGSECDMKRAYCFRSPACIGPSTYRGPLLSFGSPFLDENDILPDALQEYLEAKGIGIELTHFLLHHLHEKEQGQYVNWLQKLESFVAKPVTD